MLVSHDRVAREESNRATADATSRQTHRLPPLTWNTFKIPATVSLLLATAPAVRRVLLGTRRGSERTGHAASQLATRRAAQQQRTSTQALSRFGYVRERAELLGGTLATEATSCGFRVELDVPT